MAAEGSDEWVKIMADDFTATVSKRILLAQADSHLAQLVEYALQRNPSSPEVRLDTSAAVAAEVVAALRQGPAYALPAGDRRLLAAVKHQLDYLGLQLQPAAGEQHYLVVPTYDLATNLQDLQRPEKYGLLMYSSAARGWANRAGRDDPRPNFLKQQAYHEELPADFTCLAGVIRAEYTSIGEDVIYFVNGGVHAIGEAAGLTATGKVLDCRPPPAEFALICDAAMTAVKSHLYMLGGENLTGQWATTPLLKYDPSIDTWPVFLNMLSDGLCQLAADSNDSPALNCLLSPCLRKQTHLPEQVTAEQLRLPGSPRSCRAVAQAVTNVWLLHAQV